MLSGDSREVPGAPLGVPGVQWGALGCLLGSSDGLLGPSGCSGWGLLGSGARSRAPLGVLGLRFGAAQGFWVGPGGGPNDCDRVLL